MKISVVIPTYNRYEPLKRALRSIYCQSHQPVEVIVIDDGSTDNTSKIAEDFPKIKYFYQGNRGVSSARNRGIKESTSDWIAFLDSDDEWHKYKLEEQVKLHKKDKTLYMSYTDERWVRDSQTVNIPKKFKKFGGDIFENNLSHCIIAPSSALIHKKLFKSVGLFDEDLEVCEDYDLWLRISLKHKIGLVNQKLITKHGGENDQLSYKHWGMDRFRVQSLEKILKKKTAKDRVTFDMLLKKYELLLKGAMRHDKYYDVKDYKSKIEFYKKRYKHY